MTQRNQYISFRVGPKLHAAVRDRAQAQEKTVSEWARAALERELERSSVPAWAEDDPEVTMSP